jgi:tetratricopeptide (TPR) repeat protein
MALSKTDVDTCSDIYSLGVLLYELLTGTTPFDKERFHQANYDEMRRMIREEEPPKPSTRLSTLEKGALSTVCEHRRADPRKLGEDVRGELDWIVMKALEKDRNRRYESASAFAADVQRYLNDETVQACPPSAGYRLRKHVRRNRQALVTAGVVAVALVAATAVSTWQAFRATEAQRLAATEAAIAKAVNDFLLGDLLQQIEPMGQILEGFSGEPNLTVKEAIRRAASRIGQRFRDQPQVEAAIRRTMGGAFFNMGEPQLGVSCFERAYALCHANLGSDDPKTLDALYKMADAYRVAGQFDKAVTLLEQLIEKQKATPGPTDRTTMGVSHTLAMAYESAGHLPESIALHEKVLETHRATIGSDAPNTSHVMITYARACQKAGRLVEADRLLREALERQRKDKSPWRQLNAADAAQYLALNLLMQRRYPQAESFAREALSIFGKHYPDTWRHFHAMSLVGGALLGQQKYTEAEPFLLRGYEGLEQREATIFAPQKARVTESLERVVRFYEVTDQPEQASALQRKLRQLKEKGK